MTRRNAHEHKDGDLGDALRRVEQALDDLAVSTRGAVGQRAARLAEDLEHRARRLRRQLEEESERAVPPPRSAHASDDHARRANGWLRDLYRDPDRAWLAGVCAGLARHFGVEPWVVRLIGISLFLFNAFIMFWAYVAGVVLLARRPRDGGRRRIAPASKPSAVPELGNRLAPRPGMRQLRVRFAELEGRIRRIEGCVTSREFGLQRELTALEREAGPASAS